jgi:hypothetical protein
VFGAAEVVVVLTSITLMLKNMEQVEFLHLAEMAALVVC